VPIETADHGLGNLSESSGPSSPSGPSGPSSPSSNVRWLICALLFFATTVNYVDRQVLSILKPTLQSEFGWNETDYGWIVFAFQFAYALVMPVAGRVIDRIGTRVGYTIAVAVWSFASLSHALASGFWSFSLARFGLGAGEAANFPTAIRTVADWFPQKERSFATGIFNSGSNVGVIVAAISVPALTLAFGWRAAFLVTGGLSFLWIVPWLLWFRKPAEHPWVSKSELALIQSGGPPEVMQKVPAQTILKHGAAWAFIVGKFMTDPVWWFYLTWIPGFFNSAYHVNLTNIGLPLIVIYLMADVGSIGGGWLFAGMVSRGWTPNRSRKVSMLICAAMAVPVMYVYYVKSLWPAVILIGLAAAAHQGWSANLFTMASDAFPRRAVASVVGIGGFAGAIGGMIVQPAVGKWLDLSGKSYGPIFVIAGTMYLIALLLIHWMVPKLELLTLGENE
jgi:MFS transporter, ACS family, hexuronate transporter